MPRLAPAEEKEAAKGEEVGGRPLRVGQLQGIRRSTARYAVAPQGILDVFIPKAELLVIIREVERARAAEFARLITMVMLEQPEIAIP